MRHITKYDDITPILDMSIDDLNKIVLSALETNPYKLVVKVELGLDVHVQVGVVAPGAKTPMRKIHRHGELRAWFDGVAWAGKIKRPAKTPQIEVAGSNETHGWDCIQIHPPLIEGDPHTQERVATYPSIKSAWGFVYGVHDTMAWRPFKGGA